MLSNLGITISMKIVPFRLQLSGCLSFAHCVLTTLCLRGNVGNFATCSVFNALFVSKAEVLVSKISQNASEFRKVPVYFGRDKTNL